MIADRASPPAQDDHATPNRPRTTRTDLINLRYVALVPGAEVIQGEALTQCSLPLTLFKARGYCRVTVEDAAGGRAWSNPIQLRC